MAFCVLVVNDCYFASWQFENDPSYLPKVDTAAESLRKSIEKTNGYFGLACLMKITNGAVDFHDTTNFKETTWKWAGKKWGNIINFTDVDLLRERLDQQLPTIPYETQDCEYKEDSPIAR